jgi:hypothetical protein
VNGDDLDRLERLTNAATPGDLYTDEYELYLFIRDPRKGDQPVFSKGPGDEDTPNWYVRGYGAGLPQEANAAKMIAAWNNLAPLVARLRELEQRCGELEAQLRARDEMLGPLLTGNDPPGTPKGRAVSIEEALRRDGATQEGEGDDG